MSWKVAAQYLLRQPQHHRQKNENNVIYRRYCKGIAQCSYRGGHAYLVKNPMVCQMGSSTNF